MIHAYSIFKYRNEKQKYICFGQITYQDINGMFSKPIIFDFNAKNNYLARARFWSKNKDDYILKLKNYYYEIDFQNYKEKENDELFFNVKIGSETIQFIKNYFELECKIFNIILSDCCIKNNIINDYSYIEYDYDNFEKIEDDYDIFVFDKKIVKIKRMFKYVLLNMDKRAYSISKPSDKFIKDFKFATISSRYINDILKEEYKKLEEIILNEQ